MSDVPVQLLVAAFQDEKTGKQALKPALKQAQREKLIKIDSAAVLRKDWTYVGWVALFSTSAGIIYGSWVDGASGWVLGASLGAFLAALFSIIALINRFSGEASPQEAASKSKGTHR